MTYQARTAFGFIDSIGVSTHLNYLDTVYHWQWPAIRDLLNASGIRHVRDAIPTMDPWYYARLRELKVRFLGQLGANGTDLIARLRTDLPSMTAIEGLNEWDLNGGPGWVDHLRAYQPAFYTAAKAPRLLTTLGPSVTSGGAFDALGDLAQWMDRANLHNYYGTRHPETQGWGDDGYGSLDWSKRMSAMVGPGVPVWSVETGYPCDPGYAPAMPGSDMPAPVCVKYVVRLLAEHFLQGIERTYLYQFADDFQSTGPLDGYSTFGLVRADGTPKPTYQAVKSLIALLKDVQAEFTPQKLDYTLSQVPDLRRLLLQKRDGALYLLLWLGRMSMDPHTRAPLPEPREQVVLTLPAPYVIKSVSVMGDTGKFGSAPRSPLHVSDRMTVVKIGR
jgi:hypothetical protein